MPQFNRRAFIVSCLSAGVSGSALASAPPKDKEGGDPYVKLTPIALPVIDAGKVVNYLFVTLRINLTPKADVNALRLKEPYFRDALIRVAHTQSFALANTLDKLDEVRLKKVATTEFAKITGPGAIQSIEILAYNPRRSFR